jgi:hypothetical protein
MKKVEDILKKYSYDASEKAHKESKMVQKLKDYITTNSLTFK